MKLSTVKRIFVTYLVNHIFSGTNFFEVKRNLLNSIGYETGDGTKVVGPIYNTGKLKIGKNCWIGANTVILRGTVLGDNCVVGAGSVLKGHYESGSIILQKRETISKEVKLEGGEK